MPINNAMAKWGMMWPVRIVGRPGMMILHWCVNCTVFPSSRLIMSGFIATRLLSTSPPSTMKMEVAPVSAMAWSVAMAMAAATAGGSAVVCHDQFNATTIASSCMLYMEFRLVSKEGCTAETKRLNLFAISFSAPHCQVYAGSTFLCIPFWHGLYPAVM